MASIERLLQELGATLGLAGEHDAENMQLVLIGPFRTRHVEPHEQMTQLCIRQAGPDDRTVKGFREFPYFATSP